MKIPILVFHIHKKWLKPIYFPQSCSCIKVFFCHNSDYKNPLQQSVCWPMETLLYFTPSCSFVFNLCVHVAQPSQFHLLGLGSSFS